MLAGTCPVRTGGARGWVLESATDTRMLIENYLDVFIFPDNNEKKYIKFVVVITI
jgi:hypothetical protein